LTTKRQRNSKIKDVIEKEIQNLYMEVPHLDNKKGHKRIVSMKEPEFTADALLESKKDHPTPSLHDLGSNINRHDRCKAGISEYSPQKKKHLSKAEYDAMVDRLYTCWKVYKEKLDKRIFKQEEELLETNTFKPEISENSKFIMKKLSRKHLNDDQTAKYLPIYKNKRLKEIESHKQLKREKIKDQLRQKELEEKLEEDRILEKVAEKTSSTKYNQVEFLDNVETYCKQYKDRKEKEKEERESKYSDITFKPTISQKSKNILKKTGGSKSFSERQAEYQQKQKEKKNKLMSQLAPSFRPSVNRKSKLIQKKIKNSSPVHNRTHNTSNSQEILQTPIQKVVKDPIACHLNYDIEEVAEDSIESQLINNQYIKSNEEEIQEISAFINNSKNNFNESEVNSQTILDMIFSKTNKIQLELDQFK